MEVFLVGGAVRDKLLNYPVIEHDWVVVGASPQNLLDKGYKQVGKDFPVFLHPETGDEYALARTERKSGKGYYGFEIHADKDVSLEQDLQRRDLTINAIAMAEDGTLIDPYNGQSDLSARILRHVSPAFCEDPLRVLRVARFAARYHHLGFSVAEETMALMQQIVASGELQVLAAERIWKETYRALGEKSPQIFFETLRECNALEHWFPELNALWGIPNPAKWHPEIDTGIHTMMVLEQAAKLSEDSVTRYAALCHDLGKGNTPEEELPRHKGHEKRGIPLVEQMSRRLKTPVEYEQLAKIASEFHLHLHKFSELKPKTIVKVLEKTDAFRKPARFEQFLQVCEADFKGRTGFEDRDYPQSSMMKRALEICQSIKPQTLIAKGFSGKKLGEAIHEERVNLVKQLLQVDKQNSK
ncbi:multifunctional CCA addition/repair protein [Aliikangiella coralliicola]|uniref:Multifunctional CCA protein n=1 Tax=Aliikangiella coralliicola TaxID=2592383 RepID=A0A545UE05_9GAMM|nr:multifunctional CCA addition/repair protein [Aliikangiella coralliicola]TQV87702.1 multifunctional CCA addition/repair protein [Aliikangiella coralliicola]